LKKPAPALFFATGVCVILPPFLPSCDSSPTANGKSDFPTPASGGMFCCGLWLGFGLGPKKINCTAEINRDVVVLSFQKPNDGNSDDDNYFNFRVLGGGAFCVNVPTRENQKKTVSRANNNSKKFVGNSPLLRAGPAFIT
jgi:hypothetical protein